MKTGQITDVQPGKNRLWDLGEGQSLEVTSSTVKNIKVGQIVKFTINQNNEVTIKAVVEQ